MKVMSYPKTCCRLKRFIRNIFEWIQIVLMLIGAFAVYAYSKQHWPEAMNYTTDLASSALSIGAIGFFVVYYLVSPFLEGFREAGDPKQR